MGKNSNSVFCFVLFCFSWGGDFSSPPKFLDVLSTCVAKVSLGEARMHINQDSLLNKKKRLRYGVSLWPEYN